jgi:transcriptional regulator with XRE-family HTH domain
MRRGMEDPSRRLRAFFVPVCVEIRTRAGASQARVADLAGLGEASIYRFEQGKNFPQNNLERYAAAYAALEGIDPRELFARVIGYWLQFGNPPLIADDEQRRLSEYSEEDYLSPEAILSHIIRAERQIRGPMRDRDVRPPTSIRSRRATGG